MNDTFIDLRDQYLARVTSGKTFGEVGGLWGTINEKCSVAHQLGATELTMIDVLPLGDELWRLFEERMSKLGITDYHRLTGDICDVYRAKELDKPYDVVHCSGVLYHHPNPMLLLSALRSVTSEHLVLTSCITQDVIENEMGRYEIPPSGVLFVPALNDSEHAILKAYWEQYANPATGLTNRTAYDVKDFTPWWWLPTTTALASMCETAGFKIVDSGLTWNNNCLTLLLSV